MGRGRGDERGGRRRCGNCLVGGGKRFGFLDLHGGVATFDRAVTRLVAQNLGSALFAHIALSQRVGHCSAVSLSIAAGPNPPPKFNHSNGNSLTTAGTSPSGSFKVTHDPGCQAL